VSQSPPTRARVTIPLLDLRAQFAPLRAEIMAAIEAVMESQHFIMGNQVRALEAELAAFIGVRAAHGCASGSDALALALMAAGIGAGDEVITTPFTFVATAGAIARLGARPVFVDIDPRTFAIDHDAATRAISSRTRALLPVHLYGLMADMAPLMELAQRHGLTVIEDAAQAIGARYRGEAAGAIGAMGCFSFYPTKNLGGAGDGGMVTSNDPNLAERVALLRDHGSRRRYNHEILGTNSRLDELQAAVLRVKLRHLAQWNERRREIAARYRAMFEAAGLADVLQMPAEPAERTHVYHQFTIRAPRRDQLREFLQRAGVATEVYYPTPLHLQPLFAYLGYRAGEFPNAESASREVLSLPIYPELPEAHQIRLVATIREFYGL